MKSVSKLRKKLLETKNIYKKWKIVEKMSSIENKNIVSLNLLSEGDTDKTVKIIKEYRIFSVPCEKITTEEFNFQGKFRCTFDISDFLLERPLFGYDNMDEWQIWHKK
jgi:hypothetical protein